MISALSYSGSTPKNYSRKGTICSCLCLVSYSYGHQWVTVKYQVTPNQNIHPLLNLKKNQWATQQHWGSFDKIIELPSIFEKLENNDYIVRLGSFTRDKIQMPFIYKIEIVNVEKYKMLLLQESRTKKLKKINDAQIETHR